MGLPSLSLVRILRKYFWNNLWGCRDLWSQQKISGINLCARNFSVFSTEKTCGVHNSRLASECWRSELYFRTKTHKNGQESSILLLLLLPLPLPYICTASYTSNAPHLTAPHYCILRTAKKKFWNFCRKEELESNKVMTYWESNSGFTMRPQYTSTEMIRQVFVAILTTSACCVVRVRMIISL